MESIVRVDVVDVVDVVAVVECCCRRRSPKTPKRCLLIGRLASTRRIG